MRFEYTAEEHAFVDEVRAFLARVFPEGPPQRGPDTTARWEASLIERGWQAYKWDPAYGGTGWTLTQKYIWEREVGAWGLPTQLSGSGISMLGPILYGYGSDYQKSRYLPRILDGTQRWCQGYSEPGAGSDLAGLATKAVREGDHYVVTGNKIWTSGAHKTTHMFCLVRTATEGKPQAGISFLLLDMADPAITVRPIISIDGNHSLNAVELSGVRVAVSERVGEENRGWTYAKGLLTHERTGLAFVTESLRKLDVLKAGVEHFGLHDDAALVGKIREVDVQLRALVVSELRALDQSRLAQAGQNASNEAASFLKLKGTAIVQRLTELLLECSGHFGIPYNLEGNDLPHDFPARRIGPDWVIEEVSQYLIGRSASIAGGSDEVQRNIIAKHVLGL